jgi:uncharacterized membrane protein (DUF106 family)
MIVLSISVVILAVLVALMGLLVRAANVKIDKLSKNQAIMVTWCETLRENEEQLLKDLTRLQHEILNGTKKESRR